VKILALSAVLMFLSACAAAGPPLGGAPRLSLDERNNVLDAWTRDLHGMLPPLYSEMGVQVDADGLLTVNELRLAELAAAFERQFDLSYVTSAEEILDVEGFWDAYRVTTEDFEFEMFISIHEDTVLLEINVLDNAPFVIVPHGGMVNGILKDIRLFRGSETERGKFNIEMRLESFYALEAFGITLDNTSSLAWLLTALNTETREAREFILASAFPVSAAWEGVKVSDSFSAAAGVVVWLQRGVCGSVTYFCIFNGSETQIQRELRVEADNGDLIAEDFVLNVESGVMTFIQLGFDLDGVRIYFEDSLIHVED
jgi:hypothetical protein